MIRVRVEYVPFGIEQEKEEIGWLKIWNDGKGTWSQGDYKVVRLLSSGERQEGEFKRYPRLERNVWSLIKKAIIAMEK